MHTAFTARGLPLALAAILSLAGCTSQSKQPLCPGMAALVDASSQSFFRDGTAPDPGNVIYTVRITNVNGECDIDKGMHQADASFEVGFRATRAPTSNEMQYSVPYFVVVSQADRIISRENFTAQFRFAPGQAVADFSDSVSSTVIKAEKGKRPYDYQILVGLPLTKEQLDYNRTIGRFTQ